MIDNHNPPTWVRAMLAGTSGLHWARWEPWGYLVGLDETLIGYLLPEGVGLRPGSVAVWIAFTAEGVQLEKPFTTVPAAAEALHLPHRAARNTDIQE